MIKSTAVKAVLLLFLAQGVLMGKNYPRPTGYVNDFASVLGSSSAQQLEALLSFVDAESGVQFAVVTVDSMGGDYIENYTQELYDEWGIGRKGEDKGLILLVAMAERRVRIETGYGLEGVLPPGRLGQIRDRFFIPYGKQNRFEEAILATSAAIVNVLAEEYGIDLSSFSTGNTPAPSRRSAGFPLFRLLIILIILAGGIGRIWLFPLLFAGMGRYRGYGGYGGGFGGFSGGFGGFGGGMSSGGGVSGSF